MSDKIKIDIVSDVVCPWCLIGYKRLEQAIEEMGVQDRIEIEWQPFELNPNMPAEGENGEEYRARKYGMSPEEGRLKTEKLKSLGAESGILFDHFEGMKIYNTQDAHILIDYAKEFGLQTELKLRLASAFHSERKDISDREILGQELQSVGLNAEEAMARLDNVTARENVKTQ